MGKERTNLSDSVSEVVGLFADFDLHIGNYDNIRFREPVDGSGSGKALSKSGSIFGNDANVFEVALMTVSASPIHRNTS